MFLPTVNPADPENVFLRCDMTGAYVTHNGGRSWRMFHLRTVVRDFEFDPSNPNTVYASNSGLYRSDNRGTSWKLIYPAPEDIVAERMIGDHAEQYFVTRKGDMKQEIVKVRVDPEDSGHIYLGLTPPIETTAASGRGATGTKAQVLVSNDQGQSWQELADLTGTTVLAIIPGCWDGKPDEVTVVTDLAVARISESTGEALEVPRPSTRVAHAAAGKNASGSVVYLLTSSWAERGYNPPGTRCTARPTSAKAGRRL